MELYPIKFNPRFKSKIWGGNKLKTVLNKEINGHKSVGESWEISCLPNELSVVSNGLLQGRTIDNLIQEFRSELVGGHVYEKFGNEFPLLIKFIDANDYLSIQVHPDDELAKERHNSFGKTEMWYVVDAKRDAELIVGFNQPMDREKYLKQIEMGKLKEVLNYETVDKGDAFFIPAGRIHATGPGILFAEVQQTSDITYRIYDWDRVDDKGNARVLHTELAKETIDFDFINEFKSKYNQDKNKSNTIAKCDYFTTNLISLDSSVYKDYSLIDSFVVYMAIEGHTSISYSSNKPSVMLKKGETILIPAALKNIHITPISTEAKILEIYIAN